MWKSPLTQKNIRALKTLKNFVCIDPAEGTLASGDKGLGVLAPLEDIVIAVQQNLKK